MIPIYLTCFFEYLGCRFQTVVVFLGNGGHVSVTLDDLVYRLFAQLGTKTHQAVIDIFNVSIIRYVKGLLVDDSTCINVLVQEESCYTGLSLSIDYRPVYGGSAAVLRQEGSMHVEGAKSGHPPYHFGQHAEGNDSLDVGVETAKLFDE